MTELGHFKRTVLQALANLKSPMSLDEIRRCIPRDRQPSRELTDNALCELEADALVELELDTSPILTITDRGRSTLHEQRV